MRRSGGKAGLGGWFSSQNLNTFFIRFIIECFCRVLTLWSILLDRCGNNEGIYLGSFSLYSSKWGNALTSQALTLNHCTLVCFTAIKHHMLDREQEKTEPKKKSERGVFTGGIMRPSAAPELKALGPRQRLHVCRCFSWNSIMFLLVGANPQCHRGNLWATVDLCFTHPDGNITHIWPCSRNRVFRHLSLLKYALSVTAEDFCLLSAAR